MRDRLNVTVGDHASRLTPETLTSQNMAIIFSVSNVPLAPTTEDEIVAFVVFFFLPGGKKAARVFERKTRLDVK